MNPPEFFSSGGGGDGSRPSPRRELQGPRPAALKVNKDSYKIRKPPIARPPHPQPPPPGDPPQTSADDRQPVIIYAVSPKVIHTTVSDFMGLVQRLTGNGGSEGGNLSPAARLASIERTSPAKEREIVAGERSHGDLVGDLLQDSVVELGRVPGILSPAPASLPPVSAGLFSPTAVDPFMSGYNMFIPSPSTLFSVPMASPSPSSLDLFNPFFDF
ncbi:Protein MKS1 [Striga hermonthica]|uniref:Protein MKS1 n=1 Tax=Striga hermonthica TaxID=68872 RepID=A0A9N7MIE0_STRHE|nr:Protein MKS1 [Striga hermonthica]